MYCDVVSKQLGGLNDRLGDWVQLRRKAASEELEQSLEDFESRPKDECTVHKVIDQMVHPT